MTEQVKEAEGTAAVPEVLSQEQALGVLIQAARIGQKAGAYTLEDAEMIAKAIKLFVPATPAEGTEAPVEPTTEA